jgi:ABC-type transporter Mla MlaB component
MTLRIIVAVKAREAVVALHGWLSGAEVTEMEKVAAAQVLPVTVDLSQLAGVDTEGLRALRRLRGRGARLAHASPYIELMLERTRETDGDEPVVK